MIAAVMLLAMSELAMADDGERVGCLVNWTPQAFTRGGQTRGGLSDIAYGDRGWDAGSTYRQLVVLVSFADCDFSFEDPQATYHDIFNTPGYTQRDGDGHVEQVTLYDENSITDINRHEDGTVSFNFHTSGSGIFHLKAEPRATGVYTLSGQKLRDFGQAFTPLFRGVFIINGKKKIVH